MDKLDKEELEKLAPEERIKRLKEFEEARKKEIEEAEKLIEATEEELETQKRLKAIEVPEPEQIDISALFAPEEEGIESLAQETQETEPEQIKYDIGLATQEEEPRSAYLSVEGFEGAPPAKLEGVSINIKDYHLEAKRVTDEEVASRGVLENIRKYSKG